MHLKNLRTDLAHGIDDTANAQRNQNNRVVGVSWRARWPVLKVLLTIRRQQNHWSERAYLDRHDHIPPEAMV